MPVFQLHQFCLHQCFNFFLIHGIHYQHQAVVEKWIVDLRQFVLQGQKAFHSGLRRQVDNLLYYLLGIEFLRPEYDF